MLENSIKSFIWDGPDIPCLNICKHDSMSEAMYKVAKGVCELDESLNFEDLTYECIIDKSRITGNVNLFLLFSILLKNDCDLKELIDLKIDELDTTEKLVENLDLKCLLQDYLDHNCQIVRFYNSDFNITNPNDVSTVFQNDEVAIERTTDGAQVYYVSDIDQRVWTYRAITSTYILSHEDLNFVCICDLESLDLDLKKTFQVIIRNLCQLKSTGVVKAGNIQFNTVVFDTVDPNDITTTFMGQSNNPLPQDQTAYYISKVTHKIWRWIISENAYLPSVLTGLNINFKDLSTFITIQENNLQQWIDLYEVYEEPTLTSCLDNLPLQPSVHIPLVTDDEICTLSNQIGSKINSIETYGCKRQVKFTGDQDPNGLVAFGLGEPQATEGVFYVSSNGTVWVWEPQQTKYILYETNLLAIEQKQWGMTCDILNRLKDIEINCCGPSCTSVKLGFSTVYNDEDGTYTITFNSAAGTHLPEIFSDCGSELFVTDHKGVTVSMDIELLQGTEIEINTSTLDNSRDLALSIKTCHTIEGVIECKKCISGILPAYDPCGFCKLCAIGGSEETIQLFYTLASNPGNAVTQTLHGGNCISFALPVDFPTITAVYPSSENITLENDASTPCTDIVIPPAVNDSCWFFEMPITDTFAIPKIEEISSVVLGGNPQIDFSYSNTNQFTDTYFKYYDYLNPPSAAGGGTLLGGEKILNPQTDFKDNKYLSLGVPTGLPPNVISVTKCTTTQYHKQWDIEGQGSNYSVVLASSNTTGIATFSLIGSGAWKLKSTITQEDPGRWGLLLKITGQQLTPGVQYPEIAIKNAINGAVMYIKGQYVNDECQCPE